MTGRHGPDATPVHAPVLLKEVLGFWHRKKKGHYIDGTVGTGGHTEALLSRDPGATCLAIDRDPHAIGVSKERLKRFGDRVILVRDKYSNLPEIMRMTHYPKADGLLLDLGVSTLQLETPGRGFSFNKSGPLDMRMDDSAGETALELIHRLSHEELAMILTRYGEVKNAGRIALALKKAESGQGLKDTLACSRTVAGHSLKSFGRIHPATTTFQALRIAVNDELGHLDSVLKDFPSFLAPSGRAIFISFHSLEDRLVKNAIRSHVRGCVCPSDFPKCVCGRKGTVRNLTASPVRPLHPEMERNPRSRSAKLRVAEKISRQEEASQA